MKKLFLFVVFLLLVACNAEKPASIIEQESPGKVVVEVPESPKTPVEVPSESEVAPSQTGVDPAIGELVAKKSKLSNVRFRFIGPGEVPPGEIYNVDGSKVRVDLRKPFEIMDWETYYDTVFLDYDKKTAVGYCRHQTKCLKKEFVIDFSKHGVKLPREWDVPADAKITGVEQFDNRDVKRVAFSNGFMLLDEYYGIPLKVSVGSDVWTYNDLAPNAAELD